MHQSNKTIRHLAAVLLLLGSQFALAQPTGLPTVGGQQRPQPLPLEQAFPWYVSESGEDTLAVTWTPASGHYLYRHAFAFSLQSGPEAAAVPVDYTLPEGLEKTDLFFGDIEAYYNAVTATLSLPDSFPGDSGTATLWIEYQGCAEWGFCYPPQRQAFEIQP